MSNHRHADALIARARGGRPVRMAIVHPVSAAALLATRDAVDAGLIEPVLVGPEAKIRSAADEATVDISPFEFIGTEHSHEAAERSCTLVANGTVAALVKGALHTDELLHAILAQPKVRGERRLSHAFVLDDPAFHKPFVVTDGAINIAPTLADKADIIRNAVALFEAVGPRSRIPLVAALAAVETVNPAMPATVDAAALSKMGEREQLGRCIVDGPLAFDNAISSAAADEKGINSPVAGDPDILVVPDLESGNLLAKQLIFLGQALAAGIVLGARVPIALTSRADGKRSRLFSIALAVLLARGSGQ